jgi:hypothetical protein
MSLSDVFSLPLKSLHLLFLFTFCQVCLPVKESTEIETGMAEKSSWDQANMRQKLGLAWRNIERKLAKLSKRLLLLTVLPLNYFMVPSPVSRSCPGPAHAVSAMQYGATREKFTLCRICISNFIG